MSERSHRHNPAAHSRSHPMCAKRGRSLSNSSAISNCEPHGFIRLRASATVSPESLAASLSSKRGTEKKTHSARRLFPQGHRVRAPCPNKRCKDCVCVIGCQITRTRIHTLLKCFASARHDNREKTVLLPECTLQTNQSVKTKKRMMYSPSVPYIAVAPVVTS